jgi:hypothetical protein
LKIPAEILALFETETQGLTHGSVRLELFLRDGHPRFTISRERSIIPEDEQSGDQPSGIIGKKNSSLPITPTMRRDGKK